MEKRIEIHNRNIDTRIKGLKKWKISEKTRGDIIRFLEDLELGKVNKGYKISKSRRLKYLDLLKIPLEFIKKDVEKISSKDLEEFEKALSSGKIKSIKGRGYAHSTQVDIRKALRIYLKWKLGEGKGTELTNWFDVRYKNKTPDYLREEEIDKLFKACKDNEQRFLIAILFDSGARATEFHNIRYEDIMLPEGKDNFVKIALREEYSKTKGRTIGLFWKRSTEAIKDYINDRIKEGIKYNDPIYKKSYDNSRRTLWNIGKRVLNKSIHYHLFRHSSATYYASKLNRQQLCMRYGWKFSSDMPDVYISRAGVEEKELDNKFSNTQLEEVKDNMFKLEQENKLLKNKFENIKEEILKLAIKEIKAKKPSLFIK